MRLTKLQTFTLCALFLGLGQTACDANDEADRADQAAADESDAAGAMSRADAALRSDAAARADASADAAAGDAAANGGTNANLDDSDAGLPPDAGAPPGTFTHIYEKAFKTCRLQCHGMGFSMLDMSTREAAYDALVDHESNPKNQACAELGLKRVEPGDPAKSLLYLKLDIHAPCGQQMPPGGLLPEDQRNEVRGWIAAGAPND